ncbi:MAG: T9SS type A sorting domain-containing protein [Crocinitomicaceae bacterium]|nr:T9SS type A sorting domain-containing protein [Crocinitomicaceae bacterium]
MKKLLLISGLVLSFSAGAQIDISRDVIGSAGTQISNANMQVSFTIGETFTASLTDSEIHTLGFQQTNQSTISLVGSNSIEVGLYPNPAAQQITFVSSVEEPFSYKVFDITGRIVLEGSHYQAMLTLDVSNLVKGKYFFEYTLENQVSITTAFITIH